MREALLFGVFAVCGGAELNSDDDVSLKTFAVHSCVEGPRSLRISRRRSTKDSVVRNKAQSQV
jgi:hypothetical protein